MAAVLSRWRVRQPRLRRGSAVDAKWDLYAYQAV